MQGEFVQPTADEIRRDIEYAERRVRMEERKKLLRLRWGFARLNYLFFKKYFPLSKDEFYWQRVTMKFRNRLDLMEKYK